MGWDTVVRSGVKLADSITQTLQPLVTYYAWTGQDVYGKPLYSEGVKHRALVDTTVRRHRMQNGQEVSVRARVSFFRPMPGAPAPASFPAFAPSAFAPSAFATGSTGIRVNPIDPRDRIVLPDGTTGPIVDSAGLVDHGTDKPYFSELWVGV